MKRREFIAGLCAAAASPFIACTQERIQRVGGGAVAWLSPHILARMSHDDCSATGIIAQAKCL